MNETKKQHYVPQFYLNAWAEKNRIGVVDKILGKCYLTTSGSIGAENYFYELRNLKDAPELQKERKVFENLFGVIETSASKVIAELISVANSPKRAVQVVRKNHNKNELARFLAYQFGRNPATREVIAGFNNDTGRTVHQHWLKSIGVKDAGSEEVEALKDFGADYKKFQHMMLLAHAMPNVIAHFCSYKWQLAFSPVSSEFFTSDLALVPLTRRTSKNIIDLCLPLSPKIAFLLTNRLRTIPRIWHCAATDVEFINGLQLEHSVQQIYHRPLIDGQLILSSVKPEWKVPLEDRYKDDQSESPKPWWLDNARP